MDEAQIYLLMSLRLFFSTNGCVKNVSIVLKILQKNPLSFLNIRRTKEAWNCMSMPKKLDMPSNPN